MEPSPAPASLSSSAGSAHDCGGPTGRGNDYDLPLHIASVFIVFFISLFGSLLPVLGKKSPTSCLSLNKRLINSLTGFGIGVVIATGFVHMVQPAMEQLNDPCLGLAESYPAFPMVIIVFTILLLQAMETEFVRHVMHKEDMSMSPSSSHNHEAMRAIRLTERTPLTEGGRQKIATAEGYDVPVRAPSYHGKLENDEMEKPRMETLEIGPVHVHLHHAHEQVVVATGKAREKIRFGALFSPIAEPKVAPSLSFSLLLVKVTTMFFEVGVYMHSVLIGVGLGVLSSPSQFTSLLIALCFHQFFEGIAVGSMGAEAFSSLRSMVAVSALYAATTPAGIIIGILFSSVYSKTSPSALLLEGVLDSVSAGILIYAGVVELLTYKMTRNSEFIEKSGWERGLGYACVWTGAAGMAVIGKWA